LSIICFDRLEFFIKHIRSKPISNRIRQSELRNFLATRVAGELIASQRLVGTTFLDQPMAGMILPGKEARSPFVFEESVAVEHERVTVRSFPYEWPPEMLHAAGALMLDLAEAALGDGYCLKDATPYNVLFRGARPVFVDVASFERRDPRDPTWLPLNQFTQTVLLPLLVNKHFGLRLDQLLVTHRDGLEPSDVARLCGVSRRLSPLFLSLVFLPHWLNRNQMPSTTSIYRPRLAALGGATVVAIDQDPAVVGEVWRSADAGGLDILPLVVNLARPTPALGWRNEECPAFLERGRGGFELVLMLAVLHHILVSEQIPLAEVLELTAELTSAFLIIEFVAPDDEMFRTIAREREDLFRRLTRESFEAAIEPLFEIARVERLHQTRSLYLLRKREAPGDV
jgi:hypothetical protein